MTVKELIALNNEKQAELNEANKEDYEAILIYIRLNSTKSERQTEEILLELLEHIILRQQDGKTVRDIFGDDLEAYAKEIIDEIPKETLKKQLKFGMRLIFIFLAVFSFSRGVIDIGLYYLFDFGEIEHIYYLGSSLTIILIDIVIALLGIMLILYWFKVTLFQYKHHSSIRQFIELSLIMSGLLALFILVAYFMPDFGTPFIISSFVFLPLGLGLYMLTFLFKNKHTDSD